MLLTCDTLPPVAWQEPAGFCLLGHRPIVYRVHAPTSQAAAQAPHLLAPAELLRAERYLRPADRQRFLVGRAALRLVLGGYTGQPPHLVRFGAGRNQKPLVLGSPGLHFSVSHSEEWIVIALSRHEVGVDLEAIAPGLDFLDALRDNFQPVEAEHIWHSEDSRQLFFQSWTRKEAFAKATAAGIDEQFANLPSLDGQYELRGPSNVAWHISSFEVAEAYSAALAYLPEAGEAPLFINMSAQYLKHRLLPAVLS